MVTTSISQQIIRPRLLVVFLCLVSLQLQAQYSLRQPVLAIYDPGLSDSLQHDSTLGIPEHYVGFQSNFYINSNSIPNSMVNGILKGEFIDDDVKQDMTDRLTAANRLGFLLDYNLTYKSKIDQESAWYVQLSDRQFSGAVLTDGLLNTTFWGNSYYENEAVDLGPGAYFSQRHQALNLGYEKHLPAKNILFGGGLSLLRGSQYTNALLEYGDLFTATNGASVSLEADFEVDYTNPNGGRLKDTEGWGSALNLYFWKRTSANTSIGIELEDLGFISWKETNYQIFRDSVNFEGITIDNAFDNGSSTIDSSAFDSIVNIVSGKKKLTVGTPARIHIVYAIQPTDRLRINVGAYHIFGAYYLTKFYIKPVFALPAGFYLAPTVSLGGFSDLDVGLYAAKQIQDKHVISIDAFYLESLLLPKITSGQGFSFSYSYLF